jgi:hypothetical protein
VKEKGRDDRDASEMIGAELAVKSPPDQPDDEWDSCRDEDNLQQCLNEGGR